MRLIIDGYNLIRQSPTLSQIDRGELEAGRRELLKRLMDYRRRKGHQIQVVFDAGAGVGLAAREERLQGISVLFTKRGETADEVIKRLAGGGGEGVVVITSDRELAASVERRGSTTIRAEEFERRLMKAPEIWAKDLSEEEEAGTSPQRKGAARRLPKAKRRRQARLVQL